MTAVEIVGGLAAYNEAILNQLAVHDIRDARSASSRGWIAIVHCDTPERWELLEALVLQSDCVAIAVVPTLELDGYVRALSAGASGVAYLDSTSSIVVDVVLAAVQGEVVLPRQAAQNLAVLARREKPPTSLGEAEAVLLSSVAAGRTVADIAAEMHFSERTVRRHLQSAYIKIGARNRAEAIAAATRLGLTDRG